MKKILSIVLLLVLSASVFVVASYAAEEPTYWIINSNCLVKAKELIDDMGTVSVPTFKVVEDSAVVDGLLVGIPVNATVGDELFQASDGYSCVYVDKNDEELVSDDTHIGTTDKLVVYAGRDIVAEYGLVTYGDADGDGVFDVIDSAIASICANGKLSSTESSAVYEAMKPISADNDDVDDKDYQYIVNNSFNAVESSKGRKIPVDQTLYFESVIYENTGARRKAAVTANDSNFMGLFEIKYNDNEEAPSASGIYSVTATVSDSDKYLVTPGTKELGFIVIAPNIGTIIEDEKEKIVYTTTVDNANKKIVIGMTDNDTSNATLAAEFEKWLNSAYILTVGGTVNPSTVASALPNRSFEVYSGQTSTLTKTPKTDVLGSYLPDDETLWVNNTASNSKTVNVSDGDKSFDFTVYFQQDENMVKESKFAYFADCAAASRGQRSNTNTSIHLYAKEINGMPSIRAAVKDGSAKIRSALGGTGLKGVLVGRADAISFQSSSSNNFTSSTVTSLFESGTGIKYSTLELSLADDYSNIGEVTTNAGKVIPVVNNVLSGMGCSKISTSMFKLLSQTIDDLNIVGKSGYCNYRCSGLSSSIRYNVTFYLEFKDYDTTEDSHKTLTIGSNVTMVTPTTSNKYDVYSRMAGNEPIRAVAPAGYKLKLTDANGNEISMSENGYYLMPYSNATISAIPE